LNAAWLDAITRSRLSSTERWVLVCWVRRAGETGEGAIAIGDLASDSGLGDRTVRRAVRKLCQRGVLKDCGRSPRRILLLRLQAGKL
jgi:hypothetical protein